MAEEDLSAKSRAEKLEICLDRSEVIDDFSESFDVFKACKVEMGLSRPPEVRQAFEQRTLEVGEVISVLKKSEVCMDEAALLPDINDQLNAMDACRVHLAQPASELTGNSK